MIAALVAGLVAHAEPLSANEPIGPLTGSAFSPFGTWLQVQGNAVVAESGPTRYVLQPMVHFDPQWIAPGDPDAPIAGWSTAVDWARDTLASGPRDGPLAKAAIARDGTFVGLRWMNRVDLDALAYSRVATLRDANPRNPPFDAPIELGLGPRLEGVHFVLNTSADGTERRAWTAGAGLGAIGTAQVGMFLGWVAWTPGRLGAFGANDGAGVTSGPAFDLDPLAHLDVGLHLDPRFDPTLTRTGADGRDTCRYLGLLDAVIEAEIQYRRDLLPAAVDPVAGAGPVAVREVTLRLAPAALTRSAQCALILLR